MQALVKTESGYGNVEILDRDRPEPAPDEVLVEVGFAGLCGSDAGIYAFEEAYEFMEFPVVIGHEYAGTVVEVGEDVREIDVGDRVVERPVRACGDCYQCEIGLPNVCDDARITGVHHDGAYAGYVAAPPQALHGLPEDVSLRNAAIAEPASVAARAVIRNSRVSPGDRVLVEGPGPIGLLTAQVAAAQGGDVIVSGIGQDADYRLPLAEALGFVTVNVEAEPLSAVVDAKTDGIGMDVVFDTTGHPAGLETAAEAVRKGGQIVMIGQSGTVETNASDLIRSEIDLQCSYASAFEDFERALRLVRSGDVDAETFVDTRFSLRDSGSAFEAFLESDTCKPVFDASELRS